LFIFHTKGIIKLSINKKCFKCFSSLLSTKIHNNLIFAARFAWSYNYGALEAAVILKVRVHLYSNPVSKSLDAAQAHG
jgi:hypothetical protein